MNKHRRLFRLLIQKVELPCQHMYVQHRGFAVLTIQVKLHRRIAFYAQAVGAVVPDEMQMQVFPFFNNRKITYPLKSSERISDNNIQ